MQRKTKGIESIESGADVKKPDNDGCTALLLAPVNEHKNVVNILQANGATMINDEMNLKTIDNDVEFFTTSKIYLDGPKCFFFI